MNMRPWAKKECIKDRLMLAGVGTMLFLFISFQEGAWGANCIETNSCTSSTLMDYTLIPFVTYLGQWAYIIIWGIVIGSIWYWNRDVVISSLVGAFLGVGLQVSEAYMPSNIAFHYGWLLIVVGVGLTAFDVFVFRSRKQ